MTSSVLQEDQFKLQQTSTRVLGHYRLKDEWFVIGGPTFRTQTFKRFAFKAGPDNATTILPNQVIEESSSEILLNLGVALESEHLRDSQSHYGVRLYAAIPLWREVENTLIPDKTFNEKSGEDWVLEGRYSYMVYPSVHVGGWAQYSVSIRDNQKTGIANPSANSPACGSGQSQAELPESRLSEFSYGLELLWKL